MSFNFDQWTIAAPGIRRIYGEPAAGFHRLLVDVVFNMPAYPQDKTYRVLELGGELRVRDDKGGQHYVGRMVPAKGSSFLESSAVATIRDTTFGVEVSRGTLDAIEKLRMGGLTFMAALHGIILGQSGFREVNSQQDHAVNQGTWVEILNHFGYKKLMMIEIPIPDPLQSPNLSKAISYLAEAQSAVVERRFRNAVGSCRDVMESLSAALEDQDEKDLAVKAIFENARSMDKERRFRVVRQAMKVLSNPAHHADAAADQSGWDRMDALSIVAMSAVLLGRFAGDAEGK